MSPHKHDPYAALRYRNYRFFAMGGVLSLIAQQMQSVAVGWELYERTGSALVLGGVGLIQALPIIFFALPGGQLADRLNRKHIVLICQVVQILCAVGLMLLSYRHGEFYFYYVILGISATAKAFSTPASASLLPNLVPLEIFSNATVWNTGMFQVATVVGPTIGGALIALSQATYMVYGINVVLILCYLSLIALITYQRPYSGNPPLSPARGGFLLPGDNSSVTKKVTETVHPSKGLESLIAGIRFVRQNKVILAALTLDLFAVLFGGAVTLLPIYAKDILHVGAVGLGWMRAAPSVGALICALFLAHAPPMRKAGRLLLWSVVGFGLATVGFGLSTSFWFSLVMLMLVGGLDNISMVIRGSLVQLRTPDYVRGRVSAVNSIFISSSNELGGFESGLAAALFGPVIAVAGGGVATLIVVLVTAWIWPEIRQLDTLHLEEVLPEEHVEVV